MALVLLLLVLFLLLPILNLKSALLPITNANLRAAFQLLDDVLLHLVCVAQKIADQLGKRSQLLLVRVVMVGTLGQVFQARCHLLHAAQQKLKLCNGILVALFGPSGILVVRGS